MFEGFDPAQYEDEARERWGHTEAYRESQRRAARYTEADWREIRDEGDAIEQAFADLLRAGESATGDAARAVAERHRAHISRWFYDCSPQTQRGLAEMYIADDRFAQHYERRAAGLATYVHDAILASAGGEAAVSR
jgi:hypothetical protein